MKKIAIVVGHSSKEPGAYSKYLKLSEYNFNIELAKALCTVLVNDFEPQVYMRDHHSIEETYEIVSNWAPAASLELHFNSEDTGKAQGTTTLCRKQYEEFAIRIHRGMIFSLDRQGKEDRGITLVDSDPRGWENVQAPAWPNALIEPFFGSNVQDCRIIRNRQEELVQGIRASLKEWFVGQLYFQSMGPKPPQQ